LLFILEFVLIEIILETLLHFLLRNIGVFKRVQNGFELGLLALGWFVFLLEFVLVFMLGLLMGVRSLYEALLVRKQQ